MTGPSAELIAFKTETHADYLEQGQVRCFEVGAKGQAIMKAQRQRNWVTSLPHVYVPG